MPKNTSATYRANEAREREAALSTSLEHVQAMHLRAAAKWAQLAVRTEKLEL